MEECAQKKRFKKKTVTKMDKKKGQVQAKRHQKKKEKGDRNVIKKKKVNERIQK